MEVRNIKPEKLGSRCLRAGPDRIQRRELHSPNPASRPREPRAKAEMLTAAQNMGRLSRCVR